MARRLAAAAVIAMCAALAADALTVRVVRPQAADVVFGKATLAAEADEPLARLVFIVDDRETGTLTAPPWELEVDLGADNVEHHVLVVAESVAGASARAAVTTSRLRVDDEIAVELRQLYLTASDVLKGSADLGRDEFTVADEGRPQRIITFERGDIPFTAVLMVDASSSMRAGKLEKALAGARAFVSGMRPLDEAALLAFSDRLVHFSPFSGPEGLPTDELDTIQAGGGTSINDYLYLAIKLLEQRNGRRTVVLLSDGVDVDSALDMGEVRDKLRHSQALLYWIRLSARSGARVASLTPVGLASAWRTSSAHRREIETLESAVEGSGGRVIDVASVADIEPAFREVLQELRDQFVIGYYPTGLRRDGSWHQVDVKVTRPGVRIRASGYLDY